MYSIAIKRQAHKAILRLPKKISERFRSAFKELAIDPYNTEHDIRKLTGREGYRLRIGGDRAIYTIDDNLLVILVVNVGSRGGIYK